MNIYRRILKMQSEFERQFLAGLQIAFVVVIAIVNNYKRFIDT